jgi:hypothetical protein
LRLETSPRTAEHNERLVKDVIEKSAHFLELALVGAVLHELLDELNAVSFVESAKDPTYFRERVQQATGLDLVTVYTGAMKTLRPKLGKEPSTRLRTSVLVRRIRSLLDICPIDDLETHASKTGLENYGHRCRVAFEGLKGFVLRNDPRQQAKAAVVGREFQRGSLSLDEVGTLLNLSPGDAAAYLEERGYWRPIDLLRLTDEQRDVRLEAIRADRLRRSGRLPFSREAIARDVIASERIENVDARRWIQRDPP